ncbi:hypothetical protein [Anderseniella sp. Alg231-50]|uniref:hypothetical protein n=1 Tax=Anderseniella sp. Alg231-50 TaxID=1922226 RepID=UPI000D55E4A1
MKIASYAVAATLIYAVSMLGVSAVTSDAAYARGSTIHAKCHWYKQQAFKLKTEAAWNRYRKCLRGQF